MSNDTRHATLLAAGWAYDPHTDLYRAPGADPARDAAYNIAAAWRAYTAALEAETQAMKPFTDPRRSRPQ